jgi:hypothetical protein
LKSIPILLKEARALCHAYIKARDRNGNYGTCISCKKTFAVDTMQAGHFFKAELYSSVRFKESNIHLRCEHCNCLEDGNIRMYEPNLIAKIGIEAYKELHDNISIYTILGFKWDRADLQDIINYYTHKLKQISC